MANFKPTNKKSMWKIIPFLTKYWYLPVAVIILVGYLWKKKKVAPTNKDESADNVLSAKGIKERSAQDVYKNITAQIAEGLGTTYAWYNPFRWLEDDKKVYELLKDLSIQDFAIIKKLYFETYAKGRDLSTDLANVLDDKYYAILKHK